MKIVRSASRTTYQGRFTGTAEIEMLAEATDDERPDVARVHFDTHAVTKWHIHPGGQMLYVIEGEGRVGTDAESVALSPGDLVVTPPGERHWHGAAEDRTVFLAITWGSTAWEDDSPDLA
jgi:quercetin dioxygenase-like cupin family protein